MLLIGKRLFFLRYHKKKTSIGIKCLELPFLGVRPFYETALKQITTTFHRNATEIPFGRSAFQNIIIPLRRFIIPIQKAAIP